MTCSANFTKSSTLDVELPGTYSMASSARTLLWFDLHDVPLTDLLEVSDFDFTCQSQGGDRRRTLHPVRFSICLNLRRPLSIYLSVSVCIYIYIYLSLSLYLLPVRPLRTPKLNDTLPETCDSRARLAPPCLLKPDQCPSERRERATTGIRNLSLPWRVYSMYAIQHSTMKRGGCQCDSIRHFCCKSNWREGEACSHKPSADAS